MLVAAFAIAAVASPAFGRSDAATPAGATSASITDANVRATACVWTPAGLLLSPSRGKQVFVRAGVRQSQRSKFVVDLLVPASLGGSTAAENVWVQARDQANEKDVVERKLRTLVCAGALDLAAAQQLIASDWTTASARADEAVTQRKAAVAAYVAAEAETTRLREVADYVASLPPPTTTPPEGVIPPGRVTIPCDYFVRLRVCAVEGEVRCAEVGTPWRCTYVGERPIGGPQLEWRPG